MKRRLFVHLTSLALIHTLMPFNTPSHAAKKRIVVVGDSLTAGYGLPKKDGFVAQLEREIRNLGYRITFVDGGISGDTASGGRARLNKTLGKHPSAVILELGANDALRGINPKITYQALEEILQILETRKIPTLLAGMRAPLNMGTEYVTEFNAIYPRLAQKFDTILYPFFLEGVALKPTLNLPDRIHPNEKGIALIVKNITPYVEQLIKRIP